MLNEQEKNALLHFLSVLNDNKIKGLANSVTQGRIQNKTREEAISCLLLHSESLISILINKKVTAACLLNYLHHLKATAPGNATKDTLLQFVYSLWKLPYPNNLQNNISTIQMSSNSMMNSQMSPIPNITSSMNAQVSPVPVMNVQPTSSLPSGMNPQMSNFPGINNSPINGQGNMNQLNNSPMNGQVNMNLMNNMNYQQQPQMQNNHFNVQSMQPSPSSFANSGSAPALQYPGHNTMSIQQPMQSNNALQPYNEAPKSATSQYSQAIASYQLLKEVSSLAFDDFMVNFAKMFYELLNAPAATEYMHGLNRSHFFDECKMLIEIKGGDEDIEQAGENVIQVLKLLSDLKQDHQLAFSPNLTPEGVRGKTDSHGLIYAVASGTLHQGRGQLVGVYEQSFILRKDPFDQNSCKIADSTLILRSNKSVNSYSQLLLPASRRTNERNLAIQNAPSSQLQITNFGS